MERAHVDDAQGRKAGNAQGMLSSVTTGDESRSQRPMREIRAKIAELGVTHYQVWLRYASFGGRADLFEFEAYLQDVLAAEPLDIALIEHAVWELGNFGID